MTPPGSRLVPHSELAMGSVEKNVVVATALQSIVYSCSCASSLPSLVQLLQTSHIVRIFASSVKNNNKAHFKNGHIMNKIKLINIHGNNET